MIGFALAAFVTDKMGRRWPTVIFSTLILINWIILYYSYEMYQFMLSRIIGGISVGAMISLTIFVTPEYCSPNTRVFYQNLVTTVTSSMGSAFSHALGIAFHWRFVALIGVIPTILGIVLPFFWVESPHWLASKGKFEECKTAFRKLHNTNSERELELLIKMETAKYKMASETNSRDTFKRLCRAFKMKYFWGLLMLSVFIHIYVAAAGKLLFSTLASVIISGITGTSDVLLYTLLVDGFIVVGSILSCLLIKTTSIRTLLFTTGFTANAILVVFSACYYYQNGASYFNWINVFLLACYFIIIHVGPIPLLEVILSELYPLELKVYIFGILGVILISMLSLTIVLQPVLVSSLGYHGLFLLNASIMSVCLGVIWLKLPDTDGRTLQEIEVYVKNNEFDVDVILSRESKTLI
ncbi:uncharacterized protein LOC128199660 [Bicyclus anynana]|uniref:Uncharacterized protein LOC128199660 n=1 Tax=Bicyclus anynana TaxID=110368 RepID=A0ABM3M3G0_BICAN|nr:uncharacterized protein LOC128199660 [Bicyclus anynana]